MIAFNSFLYDDCVMRDDWQNDCVVIHVLTVARVKLFPALELVWTLQLQLQLQCSGECNVC